MSDLYCPNCGRENMRDYPMCVNCETKFHYTERDDCRCSRRDCQDLRAINLSNATRYRDMAAAVCAALSPDARAQVSDNLRYFNLQVEKFGGAPWCEPCFTDNCKHVVSTL